MNAKLRMGVAAAVVAAATAVGVGVAAQAEVSGLKARATLRVADGTEIGQAFEGNRRKTAEARRRPARVRSLERRR